MSVLAQNATQVIQDYFLAISGKPKTEAVVNQFVSEPALKEHIRQVEAAFPEYEIAAEQLVTEGNTVAVRGQFHGIHQGPFAGIAPTGRRVGAPLMLFYQVDGSHIVKHWMVFDTHALLEQLKS